MPVASPARAARRKTLNGLFIGFCTLSALIGLLALAAILWSLLANGFKGLNLEVFTLDTPTAGSPGGLRNAIVGSLLMCAGAMVIATFVGILAGTWLAEYGKNHPYAEAVRFLNDVLLSAPSILIGVFVAGIMVKHFFGHASGWAGAAALALIAAPVITRTTEDVLKLQARQLRESGVALGAPLWHTIRAILWRAAAGGILTGGLLAFARISGETAPLLVTVSNNQFFSFAMSKAIANLPVLIAQDALTAYDDLRQIAWVACLLLAAAVLSINVLVRVLSREPKRR